jgi:hypothetical protein
MKICAIKPGTGLRLGSVSLYDWVISLARMGNGACEKQQESRIRS